MTHKHGHFEHDHLRAERGHRHVGGDLYWVPDGVAASGRRDEGEYHFVPGELLIDEQAYGRDDVEGLLSAKGFSRKDPQPSGPPSPGRRIGSSEIPGVIVTKMDAPPGHLLEMPDIVDEIRRAKPERGAVRVAPNHVFFGEHHKMWGPGQPVERGGSGYRGLRPEGDRVGAGVKIAVLDTGIAEHHLLPGFDPAEYDDPDEDDLHGTLDFEAGHGTFIGFIIRRYAPGAAIVYKRVLTSKGHVSDASLAARLNEVADAHIINLSLGGYTHDNRGAHAVPRMIDAIRRNGNPDLVVVAAAGNDHTDRPFFPAAQKGVIAVAAADDNDERADYSNFGWWVDARARGEHVSTFYDIDPGEPDAELDAPGGVDLSEFNGWARWAGTSFATPVVAAAIAAEMTKADVGAKEAARRLLDASESSYKEGIGVRVDPIDYAIR
ncbi:MAG: S8 family peptidase [Acidimicrobiales bacterium]